MDEELPRLDFVVSFYRELLLDTAREKDDVIETIDVIHVSVDDYPEPLYISRTIDVYVVCDSSYRGRRVGSLRDGVLYLSGATEPKKLTI